ncbi:MAG: hypothetical protein GC146_03680 [Limimaricola sp.]|uniref:5-bromo-4-chloroindolyl phosphate hydrolysis family protein n=1 Tax=Limimaricola sp. TaxID=2211665 RepID=UPI001DE72B81|nr:5-bromo-4-chloroindolyl phosphate hydrolysis family protein [Limimaricola sp.]MBI1416301.1 hypothetical protein [Limimaricola sp.]
MAERFGGKYSPGAPAGHTPDPADGRMVDPVGAKANLMFLPPVVLAFSALRDGPVVLGLSLIGAAMLALGAWLLREGLRAEAAYDARKVARRPALPRKMLAAGLTGIGIGVAAWTGTAGMVGAVIYGVAAAALHVAAFGIDPLADKRIEGIDTFQQDRVARVVDEAEAYLSAMAGQIDQLKDRALSARVAAFQATARRMIRTVQEDPGDLTGARKYLTVYLMGARDASTKFAEVYGRSHDADARTDYEALLGDLETNFTTMTAHLQEGGRTDMDIEIKVLRDRLSREGIKPDTTNS